MSVITDIPPPSPGSVTFASQAEAEAGTNTTKSMSPLRTAQAIAALGSSGSGISTPRVVYVEPLSGNDGTAEVGNPAKPYATAQAAFDAWLALNQHGAMVCGVGNAGGIVVSSPMVKTLGIFGRGISVSFLGGVNASGSNGTAGDSETTGGNAGAGSALLLESDGSINVGNVTANGGDGGADAGAGGGDGGQAGEVVLKGLIGGSLSLSGGVSGSATTASTNRAVVTRCVFSSYTAEFGAGGGSGGTPAIHMISFSDIGMANLSGLSSSSKLALSNYNVSSSLSPVTPNTCSDIPDLQNPPT